MPDNFGPNDWLVEDMREQFQRDPTSVSESWREFFADDRPQEAPVATQAPPAPAVPAAP